MEPIMPKKKMRDCLNCDNCIDVLNNSYGTMQYAKCKHTPLLVKPAPKMKCGKYEDKVK